MPTSVPRVSVLMPVYNGEAHLREAIESILGQTFRDFEFIIVNDGSTDRSEEIAASYADPRIRLVRNEANAGLIFTLNRGLDLAAGDYVARMDCDDISLPVRLERQVAFLDAHPHVGVCGSWFRKFGGVGKVVRWETEPDAVRASMLFACSVAHPTVMLRREAFASRQLRYDTGYPHAEDYDLWVRALDHMEIANLPEVLLDYRVHPHQVTQRLSEAQVETAGRVRLRQLQAAGFNPTPEEFRVHQAVSACDPAGVADPFRRGDEWLAALKRRNDERGFYREPAFSRVLVEKWLTYVNKCWRRPGVPRGYLLRRPRVVKETGFGWGEVLRIMTRMRG